MDLVALKVCIRLTDAGMASYPSFSDLPCVKASGLDWSDYVDRHGSGWMYDKTSGHKEVSTDSPAGQQWGLLLVPEIFAMEADQAFPDDVEILNETEAADFWENKGTAHLDDVKRDADTLNALDTERRLKVALGQDTAELDGRIAKALDPDDLTPGVRRDRNVAKRLADFKQRRGATIKPGPAQKRRIGERRNVARSRKEGHVPTQ